MNHASLFSGIGGFDLAAREVGWNNVFQCEIDPFCQSVLKYYFPKTVLYEDIKRTDFTSWKGKIDVLTGGFPCQPFSVAGQRKGADDNRYLWPEMLRVIRETRPLWVIGENVAGITNMVQPGSETDVETKSDQDEENYKETILEQEYIINTICDDLEREGYSVQPIIVPACGVGAPHKRYRIWFIASDCSDARVEGLRQGREDKIHGFEFTSQTRDKIRRLITDTSGLRSHRFLYDKEDDKKQRSTENRLFKKYACRDWDGRGSTQWKSFPTQSPICRGNDGLPFNVDNLTIPYEKFKDENCPNPIISDKMKELSKQYTHKGFLKKKEFEEETLWTLYSLQDGVTSVSPEKYKNRGNGSLRFIESFYNLKGCNASKLSKMTLQSGKANIVFDGKYPVTESMVKGEKYRVLTFNSSGNIEDKPDNKYVKCSEFFFPGTFIHAYIYL